MNEPIQIRYERLCRYSDHLDQLQLSSQRYYFLSLAVLLGSLTSVFNVLYAQKPEVVLLIAQLGAAVLIVFGFLTLYQLASLRATNICVDRKVQRFEQIIELAIQKAEEVDIGSPRPKEEGNEEISDWRFGNDWTKASFVALGNTALTAVALVELILKANYGKWLALVASVAIFDLHLLCYHLMLKTQLKRGQRKLSSPPALRGTIFLRFLSRR